MKKDLFSLSLMQHTKNADSPFFLELAALIVSKKIVKFHQLFDFINSKSSCISSKLDLRCISHFILIGHFVEFNNICIPESCFNTSILYHFFWITYLNSQHSLINSKVVIKTVLRIKKVLFDLSIYYLFKLICAF